MKNYLSFFTKRKRLTITGIIVIIVLVFLLRPKESAPVKTTAVQYGNVVASISTSGKVAAKKVVDLSFLAGGKLTYLGVKIGDHVNQYQTIAALDLRTAQKNLQNSLIDYSKQRNTFDQTQSDNQNRTPQQALNDQMKRVLQNNQYDLDKSVNSLELQQLAQEQSVLTAPIAGIVTRSDATSAGVNVGITSVFEITDPNSLVFDMDVDEADIGKVKIGQKVVLNLDAYPDENVTIPISFIDFTSHTTSTGGNAYTVEIPLIDQSAMKYRVGMNGNVEIVINKKDHVLKIPLTAIADETYVYVKTGNYFEKRKIKLGLQSDSDAQVINGLSPKAVIAIQPTEAAKHAKPKNQMSIFGK